MEFPVRVYVIDEPEAIDLIMNNDIEGFKEYLGVVVPHFGNRVCFDTEEQALAFCTGIGYGVDERAPVERYPLRSCEESDLPFIKAIECF